MIDVNKNQQKSRLNSIQARLFSKAKFNFISSTSNHEKQARFFCVARLRGLEQNRHVMPTDVLFSLGEPRQGNPQLTEKIIQIFSKSALPNLRFHVRLAGRHEAHITATYTGQKRFKNSGLWNSSPHSCSELMRLLCGAFIISQYCHLMESKKSNHTL